MVYVDVESIEDKVAAKGQRKAHIEFYRKLKALRQRYSWEIGLFPKI